MRTAAGRFEICDYPPADASTAVTVRRHGSRPSGHLLVSLGRHHCEPARGIVIPCLSLYLTSQRGVPVGQTGLVVALFGAGSFVSQLVGGELTDRLGRRPVMLMSLLGARPLMVALGLIRDIVGVAGVTMVLGFLTDLYRPAVSAAIGDVVAAPSRARAFGLSFLVGPLLGSWVFEQFSPETLWIGCAVIGFLAAGAHLALSFTAAPWRAVP